MAIYHLNAKIISKSKGQSACQSASYIAGEPIRSEALGTTYSHKKPEVKYSNILLCKNAPEEYRDRKTLWNAVEKIEKNANAQLARMLIMALPKELTLEQQIELVEDFIKTNFTDKGMCADVCIHDKGDGNPHAHIMLTMRELDENGKWKSKQKSSFRLDENDERIPIIDKKTKQQKLGNGNRKQWVKDNVAVNAWGTKDTLKTWRESWAVEQNKYLDKNSQVDHRSYADQGIDREPTKHIGYQKGAKNKKVLAENDEIIQANQNKNDIRLLTEQLAQTQHDDRAMILQIHRLGQTIEKDKKDEEELDNVFARATKNSTERTSGIIGGRKRLFPKAGNGNTDTTGGDNSIADDDSWRKAMEIIKRGSNITTETASTTDNIIEKPADRIDLDAILARASHNQTFIDKSNNDRNRRDNEQKRHNVERAAKEAERDAERTRRAKERMQRFNLEVNVPDEPSEEDDREY